MDTYKRKYEDALERAIIAHKDEDRHLKATLEGIFPELKKYEDEWMCNIAINACKYMVENFKNSTKQYEDAIAWLEKQGMKKPVDKVEPKFKVGDFIVNDYCMGKVIELTGDAYLLDTGQGIPFSCEHNAHLWTIADAKDGDVLSDGTTIFIFKDLLSDGSVMSYCDYDTDSGESNAFCPLSVNLMCSKITPATKEQSNTFFAKMHEAGYMWDAERKELKKIEQKSQRMISAEAKEAMYGKPAWSEEDERLCSCLIKDQEEALDDVRNDKYGHSEIISDLKEMYRERINWLKSIKQRIGG